MRICPQPNAITRPAQEALRFQKNGQEFCINVTGAPSPAEKDRLISALKTYPVAALRSWSEGVIGPNGKEEPLTVHFVNGSDYAKQLQEVDGVSEAEAKQVALHAQGSYGVRKNSLWLTRGFAFWGHIVHQYDDHTILHELAHALDDFLTPTQVNGEECGWLTGSNISEALKCHHGRLKAAVEAAGGEGHIGEFFVSSYAFSGDAEHKNTGFCEYFAETLAWHLENPKVLEQKDPEMAKALEEILKILDRNEIFGQGDLMEWERIFKPFVDPAPADLISWSGHEETRTFHLDRNHGSDGTGLFAGLFSA